MQQEEDQVTPASEEKGRENEDEEKEEEEGPAAGSLAQLLSRLNLVQQRKGEKPQKLLTEFSLKGVTQIVQKLQSSENSESTMCF